MDKDIEKQFKTKVLLFDFFFGEIHFNTLAKS